MFEIPMEGDLVERVAAVHEPTTTAQVASKVRFFVGDACNMKEMTRPEQDEKEGCVEPTPPLQVSLHRHGYSGILMSNLLCRLPDPMACLEALPLLVQPGSVVLILTPFTWLTEFTPRECWLGGYYEKEDRDGGSSQISRILLKDTLQSVMEGLGFCKIHEEQIPMLIREHQRKYQYCISEAMGWRKE